jgi:hypothetical protein
MMAILFTGCVSTDKGVVGNTNLVKTSDIAECQLFVPDFLTVVQFDGEDVVWGRDTLVDVAAGPHTIVCDYFMGSTGQSTGTNAITYTYTSKSANGLTITKNFVAGWRYMNEKRSPCFSSAEII